MSFNGSLMEAKRTWIIGYKQSRARNPVIIYMRATKTLSLPVKRSVKIYSLFYQRLSFTVFLATWFARIRIVRFTMELKIPTAEPKL